MLAVVARPTKRFTIGTYGVLTVEEARAAARKVLAAVTQGSDPAGDRQAKRREMTVSALIVYGLARLAYTVYTGADPGTLANTAWNNLKVMTVGDLVVYFLAFAILMGVISTIRSMVARSD